MGRKILELDRIFLQVLAMQGSTVRTMSKLSHTRDKIYRTVARQMHGVVPCWICGEHVLPTAATLEHIKPLSAGGNSHAENLAISHDVCNNQRHATGSVTASLTLKGSVQRRSENSAGSA